jgi:hypothetical protein
LRWLTPFSLTCPYSALQKSGGLGGYQRVGQRLDHGA